MVGKMPHGLVDGYSVIIYRILQELQTTLVYYLQPKHEQERLDIAYRGHRAALDYHRSYQVLERIVFEEHPTS